jgi:hypothetical protein
MVEMVPEVVYAKTPQGSDEIATRRHGLSMRVRQLLILIDGRRSVADLVRMVPDGELRANLSLLHEQGFVEVAAAGAPAPLPAPAAGPATGIHGGASGIGFVARGGVPMGGLQIGDTAPAAVMPVSPETPPAAAPEPPPVQRRDLETVRRQLVRLLVDTVGPNADAMAVRIERCRSVDEVRALLPTIASLVEAIRGRAAMTAFVQKVGPL